MFILEWSPYNMPRDQMLWLWKHESVCFMVSLVRTQRFPLILKGVKYVNKVIHIIWILLCERAMTESTRDSAYPLSFQHELIYSTCFRTARFCDELYYYRSYWFPVVMVVDFYMYAFLLATYISCLTGTTGCAKKFVRWWVICWVHVQEIDERKNKAFIQIIILNW